MPSLYTWLPSDIPSSIRSSLWKEMFYWCTFNLLVLFLLKSTMHSFQEPSTCPAAQLQHDRSSFVIYVVTLHSIREQRSLHTSWCSTWNASKVLSTCLSWSPRMNAYGDCTSCSALALVFGSLLIWAGGGQYPCRVLLMSLCYREAVNFSF